MSETAGSPPRLVTNNLTTVQMAKDLVDDGQTEDLSHINAPGRRRIHL